MLKISKGEIAKLKDLVSELKAECRKRDDKINDLRKSISKSKKTQLEIVELKEKTAKLEELVTELKAKCKKRDEQIDKLRHRKRKSIESSDKGTQTKFRKIDKDVQTVVVNNDLVDGETQTETQIDTQTQAETQTSLSPIHEPYTVDLVIEPAHTIVQLTAEPTKLYKCSNCSYSTAKKSSYDDHRNEFCVMAPVKNIKCPVCPKMFTYRSLRVHLNYYATGEHKPTDEHHSNQTPEQHKYLKEQHKQRRQQ